MTEKKILVVEDDRLVRNFILEGLQDLPHQLLFASNGLEGLKIFDTEKPDLILIDVLLPKMSGFEVCETIRKQNSGGEVPIMFMSAVYKSLAVQSEAKQKYGANDFLTKPLNLNLLRSRIDTYLHTESESAVDEQFEGPETDLAEIEPLPAEEPEAPESVQGDFAREAFPAVFFKIHRHGETGVLHLSKGKVKKSVFFENGNPGAVQSNLLNETLARVLHGMGKLTQEQIEDTRIIAKQKKKLHGQVLQDLKLITAEELDQALKLQHREKLLSLFSWTEGDYAFIRGTRAPANQQRHDVDVPLLFREGLLERAEFDVIKDRMSPMAEYMVAWAPEPPQPLAAFRLEPRERSMLAGIDARKSVKELLQESHQPDFLLRIFYMLAVAGILRITDALTRAEIQATEKMKAEIGGDKDVEEAQEIEEEFTLVEKIARKYTTLDTDNYFELLEIEHGAPPEAARKSYLELAKLYHPEKVGNTVDPSSRDKVEAIYVKITTAYEVLCDEDEREDYLTQLKQK